MPIYEYQCPECGERFSLLRPIRAMDEPAPCPRCRSHEARRVLSVTAAPRVCAPSG
jgi:putative FmdB family regulatory protein